MHHAPLAEALEALSSVLLQLDSVCAAAPFAQFQQQALQCVRRRLGFDSALWAVGALGPQGEPMVYSIHLDNQPPEMLVSYERVKHADTAFGEALAHAGTTVNVALSDVQWPDGSEPMRAHAERYGMQHTLSTVTRGPVTDLIGAIVLYRSSPAQRFTERDRLLQQNLVPHLVGLHERSRLAALQSAIHPGAERRRNAVALVDRLGMLYNATAHFIQLLQSEWPRWRGSRLPPPLLPGLATPLPPSARFARVVVQATPVNDLVLLHIRELNACDALRQREWEVATAFGNGLSHKAIANRFGIAPGTVRNHLAAVYRKLGVANKAQLANLLKRAPR